MKVHDWPDFSWFVCERLHFSDIPVYVYIFRSEIFEAACSLGIQWIDCDICLTTSNKKKKKLKRAVYEKINILDDQLYEWVCFSKARYMNEVDFEVLTRTPVPHLPPSYPHEILSF